MASRSACCSACRHANPGTPCNCACHGSGHGGAGRRRNPGKAKRAQRMYEGRERRQRDTYNAKLVAARRLERGSDQADRFLARYQRGKRRRNPGGLLKLAAVAGVIALVMRARATAAAPKGAG